MRRDEDGELAEDDLRWHVYAIGGVGAPVYRHRTHAPVSAHSNGCRRPFPVIEQLIRFGTVLMLFIRGLGKLRTRLHSDEEVIRALGEIIQLESRRDGKEKSTL